MSIRPPATIAKLASWKSEIGQLEDGALNALDIHCGETRYHQPGMTDAGKSQHLAEIGLPQCNQRSIEHAE